MDLDDDMRWLRPRWPALIAKSLLATLPVLMLAAFISLMNPVNAQAPLSDDGNGPTIVPRLRVHLHGAVDDLHRIEIGRTVPVAIDPAAVPDFEQTAVIFTPIPAADPADDHFALGSGFVIGHGIVVTAAHVLQDDHGAPHVICKTAHGDKVLSSEVVADDHEHDVAVLRVPECVGRPLVIRDTLPRPTEPLDTVGFRFGPGSDDEHISALQVQMTTSIVPQVRLVPATESAGSPEVRRLVQGWHDHGIPPAYAISGALIPGKSGSPVFAQDGTIVGMVVITSPMFNRSYVVPPGNILYVLHHAGL